MERAYLILGSNEGNRLDYLESGRHKVAEQAGKLINASSLYQTDAWGKTDEPSYLNQVIEIETSQSPQVLLDTIHSIEAELGRTRKTRWGMRTLDIDILFYGAVVVSEPNLTIPHRSIQDRMFTLMPLAEMSPDFIHPVLKKTMKQLLSECHDPLRVELFLDSKDVE